MTEKQNFQDEDTPRTIDTEYRNCNFSVKVAIDGKEGKEGVRLFPGDDTPRTYIECNLTNRIVPPGSTIINCNQTIADVYVEVERTKDTDMSDEKKDVYDVTYRHTIYGKYDGEEINLLETPITKDVIEKEYEEVSK